ncbi:MAG: glycine cleavage T C-terminal barrel domain-containing protein, partial [Geminicoccaceae bacterium]
AGKALAEWIVEGEPPLDLFALDATRFGDFARQSYTVATARDAYRRYYAIRFPKDHSSAGRPLKRAAIYDKLASKGAQFDAVFGWERPCWYAENNTERLTVGAFNRGPSFDAIGRECRGLRRGVGIADLTTSLAKHVIEGPEAEDALDRLIASRLPARPGSIVDAVMLNRRGKVNGLFTLARIGHHGFYLLGAAEAERYHQRWFEQHLPAEGVIYAPVSVRYAVLGIAGPKARILLTRVTDEDVSDKMLPADTTTEIEIAGAPAQVMHVSFTGDLGYQIHLPMEYQATVYEALYIAGQDLGLVNAGAFALKSLRLEAGFHRFPGDHAADLAPREAGLDELIQGNKGGFIGCDAMMKRRNEDALRKCVLIEIEADDADAIGGEPVYRNNKLIGSVIAGDYGHHAQMSLARAVVPVDFAAPGTVLAIDILGNRHPATVRQHPPFGPGDLPLSI